MAHTLEAMQGQLSLVAQVHVIASEVPQTAMSQSHHAFPRIAQSYCYTEQLTCAISRYIYVAFHKFFHLLPHVPVIVVQQITEVSNQCCRLGRGVGEILYFEMPPNDRKSPRGRH